MHVQQYGMNTPNVGLFYPALPDLQKFKFLYHATFVLDVGEMKIRSAIFI